MNVPKITHQNHDSLSLNRRSCESDWKCNVTNHFSSPRMPCISRAMRMRMTCRRSPIAAKLSARLSTITWCASVGLATTWTTCSTWREPTNQPQDSWSVPTAWPLFPSTNRLERNPNNDPNSGVDCFQDGPSKQSRGQTEKPRQRVRALGIDLSLVRGGA